MTVEEKIIENGYEGVTYLDGFSFETIIGISNDDRLVYDYNKMMEYLMTEQGFSEEEAIDWLEYNTIRSLPYMPNPPIIVNRFLD